ncbi:unnamed protein product [Vicia faba]|uniref:Uncharacterized protein n=1 Tax=Vicia faba TaxID=3906 RepID=A0AAV0ZAG7_VICFA|nr:unnamed protein product [Vicia faba]
MASPVGMYDVSPFQHSTEMSVQARWPHVPNAPPSSIPPSMPLHQQETDVNVNQLPEELGLVETSNSTASKTSSKGIINKTPSEKTSTDVAAKVDVQNGNNSKSNNQNASSSYRTQKVVILCNQRKQKITATGTGNPS